MMLPSITPGKSKDAAVMPRPSAATALVVASWFALNIVIGSLNGWIIKRELFVYPCLLTTVHMIVCWVLAGVALNTVMQSQKGPSPDSKVHRKIQMLSLAFCASVACGNIALNYIYVSFAQMVTSAGPLFTICLMYVMAGKRYSPQAYLSMLPMCGGVMLCTVGELNFNVIGFAAVVSATLLRGVKSIMQGKLLTADEQQLTSLELLFYMSGYSIMPLAFLAMLTEHAALNDPALNVAMRPESAPRMWGLVFLSGAVAFFLNLANFAVTKRTSAVALQVMGNVKVVVSIAISLFIFGNSVSGTAGIGCVVTLAGVAVYNASPPYVAPPQTSQVEVETVSADQEPLLESTAGDEEVGEAGSTSDVGVELQAAAPETNYSKGN